MTLLMWVPKIQQLLQERESFQRALLIDVFIENSSVMHFTAFSSVVHKCCNATMCVERTAQSTIAK